MAPRLSRIWSPACYQGKDRMKAYFEGWYFKLVDASEENVLALIPGISYDSMGVSQAFIQVVSREVPSGEYFTFRGSEFHAQTRGFQIDIGTNSFGAGGIDVNLSNPAISVRGNLRFSALNPWPVSLFSPGAMGWYAFMPFMECYHGVLSFDHELEGKLDINGNVVDFREGRGYIEKDWGRSFPRYHIWLQTNHFETAGTSLMISIANVPWRGSYFDGFLAGLFHEGRLYRFATYTRAKLTRLEISDDEVRMCLTSKQYRLEVRASRPGGIELRTPVTGAMQGRLTESLTAVAEVRLIAVGMEGEQVIFEGTGRHAGFEVAGSREDLAGIKTRP